MQFYNVMNKLEGKMVDYFKEVIMPELLNEKSSCQEMDVHVLVREVTKMVSAELTKRGEKGIKHKVSDMLHIEEHTYYRYIRR